MENSEAGQRKYVRLVTTSMFSFSFPSNSRRSWHRRIAVIVTSPTSPELNLKILNIAHAMAIAYLAYLLNRMVLQSVWVSSTRNLSGRDYALPLIRAWLTQLSQVAGIST